MQETKNVMCSLFAPYYCQWTGKHMLLYFLKQIVSKHLQHIYQLEIIHVFLYK